MRWRTRYLTAWHWLEVSDCWRETRYDLGQGVDFLCCAGWGLAWIVAAPLIALYGSVRPTKLFRFVQWLRATE